ncbi:MAG: tRNA (adenosine(37)-N6)-threonylcarbamoyltransferase complex dimerization subunit type 1 TsaB [Patescibacteria group bacterium]|jgi:tRNA threonylcarbamoyladenosine biosynthesis protein TsaB
MILKLDTANREKIYLALFGGKKEKCFEFPTEDQSADLLVTIKEILDKENLTLQNLKAILVNCGPGSFTGVRVGVTVANTLAWTLDIPIFGFKDGEQDKVLTKISKNRQNKFSKIVLPFYS